MRCPYCSEGIPADSVFCEHCGSAVMEPERTSSAEAQQLMAQPTTRQPSDSRISTTDPRIPQGTRSGRSLTGVVVGAAIGVLPGAVLLLAVFFESSAIVQVTGTDILSLILVGNGLAVVGGIGGAILGGVIGGLRKRTGQSVAAERPGDDGTTAVSDGPLYPWYRIWLRAFFRPTQDTISVLVRGHDRKRNAPYLWLFASCTIGYGLWLIPYSQGQTELSSVWAFGASFLIGLVGMILTRILVAVTQFVAGRVLGGEGTSSELFYIYAAMDSPARLAGGILALLSLIIPPVGYLGWAVSIYELVLLAIAAKVINRFSWSKAVIAAFPIIALQICDLVW